MSAFLGKAFTATNNVGESGSYDTDEQVAMSVGGSYMKPTEQTLKSL